jgi:uncharacterized protein (DUF362 family)
VKAIPGFQELFVDLNYDDVRAVAGFAGLREIYLPTTALRADIVVSVAKMKTHNLTGVGLAMENFIGLVPGSVYGWPKSALYEVGISRSILELNRIFSRSFAIVDGVYGMEGNGPLLGNPKSAGVLVFGADLVAVDATCCRIMGVDPNKIDHVRLAVHGNKEESRIEQRGVPIQHVRTNFALINKFRDLRAI